VRGEVFSGGEGVLPHRQVGDVVDGEAELRKGRMEFIQTEEREEKMRWNNYTTTQPRVTSGAGP